MANKRDFGDEIWDRMNEIADLCAWHPDDVDYAMDALKKFAPYYVEKALSDAQLYWPEEPPTDPSYRPKPDIDIQDVTPTKLEIVPDTAPEVVAQRIRERFKVPGDKVVKVRQSSLTKRIQAEIENKE